MKDACQYVIIHISNACTMVPFDSLPPPLILVRSGMTIFIYWHSQKRTQFNLHCTLSFYPPFFSYSSFSFLRINHMDHTINDRILSSNIRYQSNEMIMNGKTTTNHIIRSPLRPRSAPKPHPTSFFSFTSLT